MILPSMLRPEPRKPARRGIQRLAYRPKELAKMDVGFKTPVVMFQFMWDLLVESRRDAADLRARLRRLERRAR